MQENSALSLYCIIVCGWIKGIIKNRGFLRLALSWCCSRKERFVCEFFLIRFFPEICSWFICMFIFRWNLGRFTAIRWYKVTCWRNEGTLFSLCFKWTYVSWCCRCWWVLFVWFCRALLMKSRLFWNSDSSYLHRLSFLRTIATFCY